MTDPDIEDLLRSYQPAGPPPGLRERVLAWTIPSRRAWPWAAAAAALLAATAVLHAAAGHLHQRGIEADPSAGAEVERLTEALGGGEHARVLAEEFIRAREVDRALEEARRPPVSQRETQ